MRHTPHLLIPGPWEASSLAVEGEAHRHLTRVLRLHPGAAVTYTDGSGAVGSGVWSGSAVDRGEESTVARPVPRLTVACAVPKARERQRFVVEKLAELGVARLQWIRTAYAEGRPPGREKLRAWAEGALAQSRGAFLMKVDGLVDWQELEPPIAVADPSGVDLLELPDEVTTLVIGPEGGWAPNELAAATLTV